MADVKEARSCPYCGTGMEPLNSVSGSDHRSRWWRCANPRCRAEWLLPVACPDAESAKTTVVT